jgi:hypothetical protein
MMTQIDFTSSMAALQHDGFVAVRGAIPHEHAVAMCERIWNVLEDRGVRRADRSTWPVEQMVWGFQALTRSGAFDAVGSTRVRETLDVLLDNDWQEVGRWGQPLVTFPTAETSSAEAWRITSAVWHFDFPARRSMREPVGMRLLSMLSSVKPGGGGTLLLAGSHRLVANLVDEGAAGDGKSQRVRDRLKARHPSINGLWSREIDPDRTRRLMHEGIEVDGIRLRVVELCGEPGDVFFMHPWTLHAPSINAADVPRFMLSTTILADRNIFGAGEEMGDA